MKKLLVALASVASAMVVNAAAYSWSGAVNVYDWNNDIPGAGTVQFVIGATTYDAITFDANGDASFANYGIDAGDTVTITTTLTNFSDGSGTSVYTTVFSQDFINSFPSPDDALINILQAANTTFDAGGSGIDFSLSVAANGFTPAGAPVPEPTSGLMLLLGMAGLALKRKRA